LLNLEIRRLSKVPCLPAGREENPPAGGEQHSGVYLEINEARSGGFDKEICQTRNF
jgi:hypothetical protein